VAARNHQVHAEESDEQQLVELAATHGHIGAVCPFDRLYQHYYDTDIEDILNCGHNRRGGIHACEGRNLAAGSKAIAAKSTEGDEQHEYRGKDGQTFLSPSWHEGVVEEHQQENDQQADFLAS